MSIQKKTYENVEAQFSAWVYEGDNDLEGDGDSTVTTDLAGYSSFAFTFARREDRDAFLALLQRVKSLDID